MAAEDHRPDRGFSLLEVVVAVALFAGAIVAVLGLLGPPLQATREVLDTAVAARLANGVNEELRRLTFSFVNQNTSGSGQQIELYGIADGSRIVVASAADNPDTGNPPGIVAGERYFRILVERLDAPSSSDAFVALSIRVEWPFRLPDGTSQGVEAAVGERKWFAFNTSIRP